MCIVAGHRFNDRAICNSTFVVAGIYQLFKRIAQLRHPDKALLDISQPLSGQTPDLGAITIPVNQAQQFTDFIEAETQLLRPADKMQTVSLFNRVMTVAAGAAGSGSEQTNSLVIAYGFGIDAGTAGQLADGKRFFSMHGIILDLIPGYKVKRFMIDTPLCRKRLIFHKAVSKRWD